MLMASARSWFDLLSALTLRSLRLSGESWPRKPHRREELKLRHYVVKTRRDNLLIPLDETRSSDVDRNDFHPKLRGLAPFFVWLWQKTTLLLGSSRRTGAFFRARVFSLLLVLRYLLYQSFLRTLIHERDYTGEKLDPCERKPRD